MQNGWVASGKNSTDGKSGTYYWQATIKLREMRNSYKTLAEGNHGISSKKSMGGRDNRSRGQNRYFRYANYITQCELNRAMKMVTGKMWYANM